MTLEFGIVCFGIIWTRVRRWGAMTHKVEIVVFGVVCFGVISFVVVFFEVGVFKVSDRLAALPPATNI